MLTYKNSISKNKFDIIIVGAGLSGLLIGAIFSNKNLKIAIIEKKNLLDIGKDNSDCRASSMAGINVDYLVAQNVWEGIAINATTIKQIRVTDQYSPLFLHFDNNIIDNKPLGFMVENENMLKAWLKICLDAPNITIFDNLDIININNNSEFVEVSLSSGEVLNSSILVGADGKFSKVRDFASIQTKSWEYNQKAIITKLKHTVHHNFTAHELFLKNGVLAILPLGINSGHESAIVWIEKPKMADFLLKIDAAEFDSILARKLAGVLGEFQRYGKVMSYPLSVKYAEQYYNNRIVLIGDAIHSIHPLAGQGFNLAIKDIEILSNLLESNPDLTCQKNVDELFQKYQNLRLDDNLNMVILMDMLEKCFCNNNFVLSKLRRIGLKLFNSSNTIKKTFMDYAMGQR